MMFIPVLSRRFSSHQVHLSNGFVYVPEPYLVDVLVAHFRKSFSQSLTEISRTISYVDSDRRYGPLLSEIRQHFIAIATDPRLRCSHWLRENIVQTNRRQTDQGPTLGMCSSESSLVNSTENKVGLMFRRTGRAYVDGDLTVAELEQSTFPPGVPLCMANLLVKLKETHHMRHGGRMQLGLFLKSCGLTMEESLNFWRRKQCVQSFHSILLQNVLALTCLSLV